jgi:3alpha(or 20beta)-hydroxysteroid dehydrogenase
MIRFDDQVVIVTGAAHGQGAAEAGLFAELGARVTVADIDINGARAVAATLGQDRAIAIQLDVSDEMAWKAAADATLAKFGRIDVLVNNAGIFLPMRFLDAPMSDVHKLFAVNQTGTYLGIRVIGGHMYAQGRGAIVNVASIAALAPGEMSSIYGATKAAVVNLTKGAALELGPAVRVNCVLPGGIDTRMLRAEAHAFFRTIPLCRVGTAEDISRAVAFFASDASSYCTGASLVVDGGWTLGQSSANFRLIAERAAAEISTQ